MMTSGAAPPPEARLRDRDILLNLPLAPWAVAATRVESVPKGAVQKAKNLTNGLIRVLRTLSRGAAGPVGGSGPAVPWGRSTTLQKKAVGRPLDSWASWKDRNDDVNLDLDAATKCAR